MNIYSAAQRRQNQNRHPIPTSRNHTSDPQAAVDAAESACLPLELWTEGAPPARASLEGETRRPTGRGEDSPATNPGLREVA
jgi:hypothetical protein